ncbi:Myb-like DNA-binding domain containing protein [Histomonas meleagridis]|uniref:Myb-like DNA-binding domain containing protein n=1 Tax=Histomonas meleagridis TaxID=135588 RepID=UPI00355A019B|nr:Myb-like DNA-binding domain containing protein [Histomonas meleagridis]KAH0805880.1 Myb-like DNA-binding domain containing protein [Histomonas meleagridis]
MKGMLSSPLLDIAMASVHDVCCNIDVSLQKKIRKYFSDFIDGKITHNQIYSFLFSTIHSVQPLEKIEMILSIPDEPIPGNPDILESDNSSRKKTRTWSQFEDLRLLASIHRHGHENWAIIAKYVGNGRTRAQCSQRWHRGLDPRISKEQWTRKDDEKLLMLIKNNGLKGWTRIAQAMGNRSDVQCRYHYIQLKKEMESKGQVIPNVEVFYHNSGKQSSDSATKNKCTTQEKLFNDNNPFIWLKDDEMEQTLFGQSSLAEIPQAEGNNMVFWS